MPPATRLQANNLKKIPVHYLIITEAAIKGHNGVELLLNRIIRAASPLHPHTFRPQLGFDPPAPPGIT